VLRLELGLVNPAVYALLAEHTFDPASSADFEHILQEIFSHAELAFPVLCICKNGFPEELTAYLVASQLLRGAPDRGRL
jgi:hypothetical protein